MESKRRKTFLIYKLRFIRYQLFRVRQKNRHKKMQLKLWNLLLLYQSIMNFSLIFNFQMIPSEFFPFIPISNFVCFDCSHIPIHIGYFDKSMNEPGKLRLIAIEINLKNQRVKREKDIETKANHSRSKMAIAKKKCTYILK